MVPLTVRRISLGVICVFFELPCVANDGVPISFRSDKRVPVEPSPRVTIETPGRHSDDFNVNAGAWRWRAADRTEIMSESQRKSKGGSLVAASNPSKALGHSSAVLKADPLVFRHRLQWHASIGLTRPSISKTTSSQRQLPRSFGMSGSSSVALNCWVAGS